MHLIMQQVTSHAGSVCTRCGLTCPGWLSSAPWASSEIPEPHQQPPNKMLHEPTETSMGSLVLRARVHKELLLYTVKWMKKALFWLRSSWPLLHAGLNDDLEYESTGKTVSWMENFGQKNKVRCLEGGRFLHHGAGGRISQQMQRTRQPCQGSSTKGCWRHSLPES